MKKWSEEEIRRALNRATMEVNNDEDDQILTDAITELLTLRRRLGDKNRIMNLIVKNCDEYGNGDNEPHKAADAIIKYLTEGSDGE